MKELKSKKTGLVQILSDEDFAMVSRKVPGWLKRFTVTDIRSRPIVPSLKEVPKEIKPKQK